MTGDISEVVGFMKSGDVNVIAIFAEERLPGDFSSIPTAKEQGFDVVALNWRGLYVPKGITEQEYKFWSDALAKVGKSDEWKAAMEANGLLPFYKVGDDFQNYVSNLMEEIAALSRDIGVIK